MEIGFIGFGIMGSRMAANLQKAGYDLVVHNRTKSAAQAVLDAGAEWADTPADAARKSSIVFTMVSTPEAVEAIAMGKKGLLEGAHEGLLWADCTSVNPTFARRMAEAAASAGARFVDAPVAGTLKPAEEGQLVFLVGGDKADVAELQPCFDAMGRATLHAGGPGQGSAMKMVVNSLLGASMAAFSEAVVLGEAMGLDRAQLFDVLPGLPVVAPYLQLKRPKMVEGDHSPEFPLQWMRKDLHLAEQCAYEHDLALPTLAGVKALFTQAMGEHAEDDMSSVYDTLRKRKR